MYPFFVTPQSRMGNEIMYNQPVHQVKHERSQKEKTIAGRQSLSRLVTPPSLKGIIYSQQELNHGNGRLVPQQ